MKYLFTIPLNFSEDTIIQHTHVTSNLQIWAIYCDERIASYAYKVSEFNFSVEI